MAAAYGELTGHRDLIAFDMGGTTAKLALIEGGRPFTTTAFELHRVNNAPGSGLPMNIQAIDLVEIGAGGGSIARAATRRHRGRARERVVDAGTGLLRAGRRRADGDRRQPGARLPQSRLLRGRHHAAPPGRRRPGPSRIASRGRSACRSRPPRGACTRSSTPTWSWPRASCPSSAAATRARSRSWRSAAPGPSTAAGWPHALGVPRVILPAAAGVTAAIGLLAAEVRFDVARTYVRRLDALDPVQLEAMYAEMTAQAVDVVRDSAGGGGVTIARSVDARYVGQGYELTVPVPAGALDAAALCARARSVRRDLRRPLRLRAARTSRSRSSPGSSRRLAARRASRWPRRAPRAGQRRAQGPAARVLSRGRRLDRLLRSTIATRCRRHAAGRPGHRRGARVHARAAAGHAGDGGRLREPDRGLR